MLYHYYYACVCAHRHTAEPLPEISETRTKSLDSVKRSDVKQQSHDKSPDKSPDTKPADVVSHDTTPHKDDTSRDPQTSPVITMQSKDEEKVEIEKIAEIPIQATNAKDAVRALKGTVV